MLHKKSWILLIWVRILEWKVLLRNKHVLRVKVMWFLKKIQLLEEFQPSNLNNKKERKELCRLCCSRALKWQKTSSSNRYIKFSWRKVWFQKNICPMKNSRDALNKRIKTKIMREFWTLWLRKNTQETEKSLEVSKSRETE